MNALRPCIRCRKVGRWESRCPACQAPIDKTRDARRAPAKRVKYGPEYRRTRALFARRIAAGEQFKCARCHQPVISTFDLGHQPDGSLWPEHPTCNRSNRPVAESHHNPMVGRTGGVKWSR